MLTESPGRDVSTIEPATRHARLRDRLPRGVALLGVLPIAFLLLFFVVPMAIMAGESLSWPAWSLSEYGDVFTYAPNRRAILTSLYVASMTTLITTVLGVPLLVGLLKFGKFGRWCVLATLVLPFLAAGELVRIVAWIVILAPDGWVMSGLSTLGLAESGTSLIPSATAAIAGLVHVLLPFFVFTTYGAVRNIDHSVVKASVGMGASKQQSVIAVYLPLTVPGLLGGCLIVFVLALGYYATPAALGGQSTVVLPSLIMNRVTQMGDWASAAAMGCVILAASIVIFGVLLRFGGLRALYGDVVRAEQAQAKQGRLLRFWLAVVLSEPVSRVVNSLGTSSVTRVGSAVLHRVVVSVIVVFLAAPVTVALGTSVNPNALLEFPPAGISGRWYSEFLAQDAWVSGARLSLFIAGLAAVISVLLGLAASVFMVRGPRRWRSPVFLLCLAPLIMPSVVVALGMFLEATKIGTAYTIPGMVIGHVVICLPFAVLVLLPAVGSFDWTLTKAASSLGAGWFRAARTALMPYLSPALLAAGLFAVTISMTEVVFSLLMSSFALKPLPVIMWEGLTFTLEPTIAAAGGFLVMTCAAAGLLIVSFRAWANHSKRRA